MWGDYLVKASRKKGEGFMASEVCLNQIGGGIKMIGSGGGSHIRSKKKDLPAGRKEDG